MEYSGMEPQDIASVCAGLVPIDLDQGSGGIVSLVHYTTLEYFERTRRHWFPSADDDIARACATYLAFDDFKSGPCPTDAKFDERLQTYQLYDYAAQYWGHHAREAATQDRVVSNFLLSQAKSEAASQALLAIKESGGVRHTRDVPASMAGLHLAAYFGVDKVVPLLVEKYGRDPEDSYKRTPLSWAAQNGHEAVVRLLLGGGADSTLADNSGLTPLSWATQERHEVIKQLLLGNHTQGQPGQVVSTGAHGQTLSSTANGDAISTSKPASNSGSLQSSAELGGEGVVRLLIDGAVRAELVDDRGRQTALLHGNSSHGEAATLQLRLCFQGTNHTQHEQSLLRSNGNTSLGTPYVRTCRAPHSIDRTGQTLLHQAAASGNIELIKHLLRTDAEETADNAGRIPLAVALVHGHKEAAKLLGRLWEIPDALLSALAASKMTDLEKRLFSAASTGNVNLARHLIWLGVNIEARGYGAYPTWRGTALIEAIWYYQTKMVKFLLSSGADKTACDTVKKKSAVEWAKSYTPEITL